MRVVQVVMTCIVAVISYFLLVAFIGFDRMEPGVQLIGLAAIVAVSFVVSRKMFP